MMKSPSSLCRATALPAARVLLLLAALPLAVQAATAVAAGTRGVPVCEADGATSVELHLSTRRNATGHWNIAVEMSSEAERRVGAHAPERGLAMSLGQRTSTCNDSSHSVTLFSTASVWGASPPPGYERQLGLGWYKTSGSALAWIDAVRHCEADGAHLLVLSSDREADVVREFFAQKPSFKNHSSTSYVHLGFHDRYQEGVFVSIFGTPLTQAGYALWDNGQPSGGSAHNCGIANAAGRLLSHPCNNKYAYICEFQG